MTGVTSLLYICISLGISRVHDQAKRNMRYRIRDSIDRNRWPGMVTLNSHLVQVRAIITAVKPGGSETDIICGPASWRCDTVLIKQV